MRRRNTAHGGGTGYSGYSAPGWGHGWGRLRKEGEKLNEARGAASAWREPGVSPSAPTSALMHSAAATRRHAPALVNPLPFKK